MQAIEITPETRLIDLTVGQLKELLGLHDAQQRQPQPIKEKRLAYGMAGIASIFNCSIATANRIKRSGRIDRAISQAGRTIVVDVELALDLFNKRYNNKYTQQ